MENRNLGALSRLDDLLMKPLIQGHSGTTPQMSRNAFSTNHGTTEDDSQSDPHPEAGIFGNQTMRNCGQEDQRDMVTGVQRESLCGHDMMTGATEQIRSQHDMVTGVQRERERERVCANVTW